MTEVGDYICEEDIPKLTGPHSQPLSAEPSVNLPRSLTTPALTYPPWDRGCFFPKQAEESETSWPTSPAKYLSGSTSYLFILFCLVQVSCSAQHLGLSGRAEQKQQHWTRN